MQTEQRNKHVPHDVSTLNTFIKAYRSETKVIPEVMGIMLGGKDKLTGKYNPSLPEVMTEAANEIIEYANDMETRYKAEVVNNNSNPDVVVDNKS